MDELELEELREYMLEEDKEFIITVELNNEK